MKTFKCCILTSIVLLIISTLMIIYTPFGEIIEEKRFANACIKEIKEKSSQVFAYNRLILFYENKRNYKKAIKTQKKQIRNTEPKPEYYLSLADFYGKIIPYKDSYRDSTVKYLKKAREFSKIRAFDLISIAENYQEIGKDSLALYLCNKALEVLPKDSASFYNHLKGEIIKEIELLEEEGNDEKSKSEK